MERMVDSKVVKQKYDLSNPNELESVVAKVNGNLTGAVPIKSTCKELGIDMDELLQKLEEHGYAKGQRGLSFCYVKYHDFITLEEFEGMEESQRVEYIRNHFATGFKLGEVAERMGTCESGMMKMLPGYEYIEWRNALNCTKASKPAEAADRSCAEDKGDSRAAGNHRGDAASAIERALNDFGRIKASYPFYDMKPAGQYINGLIDMASLCRAISEDELQSYLERIQELVR